MVSIVINGVETPIKMQGLQKVTDLLELIKASIDPDHMITNILVNGEDMSEEVWGSNTSSLATSVLEVETSTPDDFVVGRLNIAPSVVQTCYSQFKEARKLFTEGKNQNGNQKLAAATDTLRAFFGWYTSIFQVASDDKKEKLDITKTTEEVIVICNKICQQQLTQSWKGLAEVLQNELEPKLDQLEDEIRIASNNISVQ